MNALRAALKDQLMSKRNFQREGGEQQLMQHCKRAVNAYAK